MGSMISRLFKKKREKTTYEKLEAIELKIKEIEEFSDLYQLKQKRFVGNVLLYGLGTSVIAFLVFYFAFLPKTLEKRILYSVPIISLPAFIFLLKNLVAYYYQRKVNSNAEQLAELRAEKRELLDQVKTKETYKDAVEILQRFGADKSFSMSPRQASTSPPNNTSKVMVNTSTNMTPAMAGGGFKTPVVGRQLMHRNVQSLQQRMNAQTPQMDPNRSAIMPSSVAVIRGMKRTPYPIIDNSQKSVVDKMVDYLIGDGPANRFAMICQQCYKHNGMALQEEYEYAAFRCAFCNFFNPAKKLRPIAPRLSSELSLQPSQPSFNIQRPSSSSDSSSCSDIDSEISKRKLQNVTQTEPEQHQQISDSEQQPKQLKLDADDDEMEIESIGDEIEFIDKPERKDIEKKLE